MPVCFLSFFIFVYFPLVIESFLINMKHQRKNQQETFKWHEKNIIIYGRYTKYYYNLLAIYKITIFFFMYSISLLVNLIY